MSDELRFSEHIDIIINSPKYDGFPITKRPNSQIYYSENQRHITDKILKGLEESNPDLFGEGFYEAHFDNPFLAPFADSGELGIQHFREPFAEGILYNESAGRVFDEPGNTNLITVARKIKLLGESITTNMIPFSEAKLSGVNIIMPQIISETNVARDPEYSDMVLNEFFLDKEPDMDSYISRNMENLFSDFKYSWQKPYAKLNISWRTIDMGNIGVLEIKEIDKSISYVDDFVRSNQDKLNCLVSQIENFYKEDVLKYEEAAGAVKKLFAQEGELKPRWGHNVALEEYSKKLKSHYEAKFEAFKEGVMELKKTFPKGFVEMVRQYKK